MTTGWATRGLILDFAGVITTDFLDALALFCAREGLPPEAAERALRVDQDGRVALAAAETGRVGQRDFEIIFGRLIGTDDRDLLARALRSLGPRQPILDLVARVRALGIPAAVLSNSLGRGRYDLYAGYDLAARFDAVVISDRVGLRKPDPAIYRLAAARLGVPPASCVFVDDSAANLPPAAELGMATVLFAGPEATAVAEIERLLGQVGT